VLNFLRRDQLVESFIVSTNCHR